MEGLDANYLTIACWALNRAFVGPLHKNNDPYFEASSAEHDDGEYHPDVGNIPSIDAMEKELLYLENPKAGEDQKKEDEEDLENWYDYDDSHPSNAYRFYPLSGLASGPGIKASLSLGEITAAGLAGLGARSRLDAERDMIHSPLFEQFYRAVEAKGFFDDMNVEPSGDPQQDELRKQEIYEDRYRKVVAKFRTKLASKAEAETVGELVAQSAAEQHRQRRFLRIAQALEENAQETKTEVSSTVVSEPASFVARHNFFSRLMFGDQTDKESVVSSSVAPNPMDLEEAEKLKTEGNTHMQSKEYQEAADCYTRALKLSPAGPNSHVYFSNRAAALVSMKKFREAILDSERSLALKPEYGKAHARLGLAHFLLGNYRQAMEAYTVALKYEPDNKSSKNYLEKAAKRLAESGQQHAGGSSASFSVVSEWGKTSGQKQNSEERQLVAEEKEAEKYKVKGNCAMANREYAEALDAYTKAINLCPHGAAALCYLEQYADAEEDSLQALSLSPDYGKAHARLGLSRFFLQDYEGAVAAYTQALKQDPDNAASKSYLAKAQAKLDARHLLDSPDFRRAAEKALSSPGKSLDAGISSSKRAVR